MSNKIEQVTIERVAHGGHGVCRIEGRACFVAQGLPGDRLEIEIVRESRGVLWGEIRSVIEPSPDRSDCPCPGGGPCPAGGWMHFAYPAQAEWKRRIVTETLERLAGIEIDPGWHEEPALRTGYRTRAEFQADGAQFGFLQPRTHDVVDVASCTVLHPKLNAALAGLRESRLKGRVEVTVNPEGEEVLVWCGSANRRLRERFPLTNTPHDEGPRSAFLFDGAPIVNGTFTQASLLLNRILVGLVHTLLEGRTGILELYCGNGNLTLGLPKDAHVIGLDHNRFAVGAAQRIGKHEYRPGDESAFCKAIVAGAQQTLLLDPPRQGAKALLPALAASSASMLVYVSCDPATLARDAKALCAEGWRVDAAHALDLFPNTPHVETVLRFVK